MLVCLVMATILAGCPQQQTTPPPSSSAGPGVTPRPSPQPAEAPSASTPKCSVCGRDCEPNRGIDVETASEQFTFCCPVCLASYVEQAKIDPVTDSITLHDFLTGDPVSLDEVAIVVESDVVCPAGRSAVALGSEENADKFIADHGGTKLSWEDFLAQQGQQ